jgi:acyl carrier protein
MADLQPTTENSPSTAVRDERIEFLRKCVAERLFLQQDEVKLESRLIDDLGADSLDFIDLLFQLESRFGVAFQQDEFIDFTFRKLTPEGFLMLEAVEQLSAWLPDLKDVDDPQQVTVWQLLSLIKVETLLEMVERKLDQPTKP